MKDILEEIIACKQKEIENLRQIVKEDILCDNCLAQRPRRSMRKALVSVPYGIIAEFKRKSPSKGWIKKEGRSDIIPPDYEKNGASALSIHRYSVFRRFVTRYCHSPSAYQKTYFTERFHHR